MDRSRLYSPPLVLGLSSGVPGIYDVPENYKLLSELKQGQGRHKQKPGKTAPLDPKG